MQGPLCPSRLFTSYIIPKISAVKVDVKLRSPRKMSKIGGFVFPIFEGGDTPNFGHACFNCIQFRTFVLFWLSSVRWAWRIADEYKKEEEYTLWTEKHQTVLLYLYLLQNPTDSDKISYVLLWENLSYMHANVFHLTWIMSLHYLVKFRIRDCEWMAVGTVNRKNT